jgi:hypothetical protein
MMKYAERVAEVHGAIGEGHVVDWRQMKPAIRQMAERSARHVQRQMTCIDTVKESHPWGDASGPSPTAASGVEPDRRRACPIKIEDAKVLFE